MSEEIKKSKCIFCKKIDDENHWCWKSYMLKKFEENAKYGSWRGHKKNRKN